MHRKPDRRIRAAFLLVIVLAAAIPISFYVWRDPDVADLIRAIEWDNTEKASAAIAAGVGRERYFDYKMNGWYFPIHAAAGYGRITLVNQLIEAGADPNQVDFEGRTPIMWVLAYYEPDDLDLAAGQLACLRRLVDAGANLEANSAPFGETALHMAAGYADRTLVPELIALGADVNARRADGNTPLHEACVAILEDPEPVVRMLLAAGADPNLANDASKTPRDLALEEGRTTLADLLSHAAQAVPDNSRVDR